MPRSASRNALKSRPAAAGIKGAAPGARRGASCRGKPGRGMELRPIHKGKRFALILKVVICVVRGQLDDQYAVLVGESGEVPVRDLLRALIGLKEPFGIEAPSRAEPLERRKNDLLVRLRAFRDVVADEVQNNSTPDWTGRIAKAACPAARWMPRSRARVMVNGFDMEARNQGEQQRRSESCPERLSCASTRHCVWCVSTSPPCHRRRASGASSPSPSSPPPRTRW